MNTFETIGHVLGERIKQKERWSTDHDKTHEPFEWLGLIAKYAAEGRYIEAAALCVAAHEASTNG